MQYVTKRKEESELEIPEAMSRISNAWSQLEFPSEKGKLESVLQIFALLSPVGIVVTYFQGIPYNGIDLMTSTPWLLFVC